METEFSGSITSVEQLDDESLEAILYTKAGNNINTISQSQVDDLMKRELHIDMTVRNESTSMHAPFMDFAIVCKRE